MPWKVAPRSELRLAFVHQVTSLHLSVAEACRLHGISRKTGYKWLARYHDEPLVPLVNRSSKPQHSPRRTAPDIEQRVLELRQQFGWGPRKIHALLRDCCPGLPSVRTLANILKAMAVCFPSNLLSFLSNALNVLSPTTSGSVTSKAIWKFAANGSIPSPCWMITRVFSWLPFPAWIRP